MNARRLILTVLVSVCAMAGISVAGVAVASAVPARFGSEGSRAGQFSEPIGDAIDQTSGDVYVVDRNNQRVDKFSSEGAFLLAWGWGVSEPPESQKQELETCTTQCFEGSHGSGAGQFDFPAGVAVDNSTNPLDSSVGDVYVVDRENSRVEKFTASGQFLLMFGGGVNVKTGGNICRQGEECGPGRPGTGHSEFSLANGGNVIAVDSLGTVYVGSEGAVQEFNPDGEYQADIATEAGSRTFSLAVSPSTDVYVVTAGGSGLEASRYDSSGTLLEKLDQTGEPQSIVLDPAGDLFLTEERQGGHILEYDSSGNQVASFDFGDKAGFHGLAWGETVKRLYVVTQEWIGLATLPALGPVAISGSETATETQSTSAALHAEIVPEASATEYSFEYGPTGSYGSSTPVPSGSLAAGFEPEAVTASLTGLRAGTEYHYRVVAHNAEGSTTGSDETFTTVPAVSIDGEFANEVTSSSATLGAELNPLGVEAEYRLEYGPNTSYGSVVSEGQLGSGSSDVSIGAHIQNLTADTTYHYRVVASDEREGVPYEVVGVDQIFITQSAALPSNLLDGRAWELVSPPDKHGGFIFGLNTETLSQASSDGSALTYMAGSPTETEPLGYQGSGGTQVYSTRGGDGWSSQDLTMPHVSVTGQPGQRDEYQLFSEDLSQALVEPQGDDLTLLSDLASERTPYVRRESNCPNGGTATEVLASECYLPLVTAKEPYRNVPVGTKFGGNPEVGGEEDGGVQLVDATSDFDHVLVSTSSISRRSLSLTETLTPGGGIYEWSAGASSAKQLQLVSVLPGPGDVAAGNAPVLGFSGTGVNMRHAVSADGSRVFWSEKIGSEPHLYMRDTIKEETVQLDVVQPGETVKGHSEPIFETASNDGSKVFFIDERPLTDRSGRAGTYDLYECEIVEIGGADKCELTDLTPEIAGSSAEVQGLVMGASEDGTYVYFVARGKLTSTPNGLNESAVVGERNLYLLHYKGEPGRGAWETRFIAGLSEDDTTDYSAGNGPQTHYDAILRDLSSRVAPSGHYLAFMSNRSLTGYDNHDAVSGESDAEVFLYDAVSNRLVCASCNPSGARPDGFEVGDESAKRLIDYREHSETSPWVAASIPGWTESLYPIAHVQSSYLSDEGRLFFNSSDALVPGDINGNIDVYEFEPSGVGDCASGTAGFVPRTDGCVGLVSSGTSAVESAFLDASENGDDVFFLSAEKLVPSDVDTAFDVYDAHVCSSGEPCVVAPVAPPQCTTADACRPSPLPQPAVFGPAASATFSGAGNLTSPVSVSVVKSKSLTRVQKLARALSVCRKKRGKRRKVCEAQARKRYGATPRRDKVIKKARG